MAAHYDSKHGLVSKSPEELYMAFTDMRNFTRMLPAGAKFDVTADYDNLVATIQGFRVGVRVDDREPYRLIRFGSGESPVEFVATAHFEPSMAGKTDFYIELDANLNLMMRSMMGGKIKEALDKLVDGLVDASEGRMPQMPDNL